MIGNPTFSVHKHDDVLVYCPVEDREIKQIEIFVFSNDNVFEDFNIKNDLMRVLNMCNVTTNIITVMYENAVLYENHKNITFPYKNKELLTVKILLPDEIQD